MENRSDRKKVVYTELNKTEKDHERNEQIMLKLYFKVVEDQNKYAKEDQRKRYVK